MTLPALSNTLPEEFLKDIPLYDILKVGRGWGSFTSFRVIPFSPDRTFASWQSLSTILFPPIISSKHKLGLPTSAECFSWKVVRLLSRPLILVVMLTSQYWELLSFQKDSESLLGLKITPSIIFLTAAELTISTDFSATSQNVCTREFR